MIKAFAKDEVIPEVPEIPEAASMGPIRLKEQCSLIQAIPQGRSTPLMETMEVSGQTTGFILYRTSVESPLEGTLDLSEAKDRVYVMLDSKLQGIEADPENRARG